MCNRLSMPGWVCVLFLPLTMVSGCSDGGPPTAHLRGSVTIGGKPIPAEAQSVITFRSTTVDQANPASSSISNGQFNVQDAPQGPVRVHFSIQLPTVEAAFEPGARPEMQYRSMVPEKYSGGLPIDVAGDNLELKFDL